MTRTSSFVTPPTWMVPAVLLLASGLGSAEGPEARVSVGDLTVEYRTNPLGIDTAVPRFSWRLESDARGETQTAYRILVASTPEELARDEGDLWDSGRVASDRSVLVPYAGDRLGSGSRCHWKVRAWDRDSRPTDWSEPARFSVGLLEPSDWRGEWIGHEPGEDARSPARWIWLDKGSPAEDAPAGACHFVRVFEVEEGSQVRSARLGMTADNQFEAWVNGRVAGSGEDWKRLHEMDVTSLLEPGTNVLAVKAVNTVAGPAGLLGTLEMELDGGRTVTVATDGAWRAALTAADGWRTAAQPGGAWKPAKVLGPVGMPPWGESPMGSSAGTYPWFRRTFDLSDVASDALVYVCSLGYHELYINGTKADDRVLAPSGSRLDKRALYVTYDVTSLLRPGRNVIALWHGPGWTRFFPTFRAEPALLVQGDILTRSGERRTIVSDASWRCHESDSRSMVGAGYGGEEIDARKHNASWNRLELDDADWSPATVVDRDVQVSAQTVEPDRVIETLKPIAITRSAGSAKGGTGGHAYRVDMGRNYTGWIEIRNLRGEPGRRITISIADDPESRADFGQVHAYICGREPGTFRNRFHYAGGRYVTVEGLADEPSPGDITGHAISTDFRRIGSFRCSNELLNRIYETDLWTFRANTLNGVTMDCPHRERLGYGEVSWATAWGCGLPNYRSGAFYAQMVRNWCDVQHENGWIAFVAPQMRPSWGGPLWSSAPLTVGWEMFRHFGDERVLQEAYPTYRAWLEFLDDQVSDGILARYDDGGRFLGDWAAPEGRKEWGDSPEALLFNNCVYALDLRMMTDIARALGKQADAALYARRLDALRKSVHARFFNPAESTYLGGRQVNLAFPLYVGVVPEEVKPAVLARLETEITRTRPYLDMGSSGLPVLLHYLIEDVERGDILHTHLSKTTLPSFGYLLEQGETTWPEYWEVNVPSRIHTCFTGVASWFIKGLGGVRDDPRLPGYKHFLIKPYLAGDLTFAHTTTESLYGTITSSWKREGDHVRMDVVVPANSSATLYLPTAAADRITESGRPLGEARSVTMLGMEGSSAVLKLESGRYSFVSKAR